MDNGTIALIATGILTLVAVFGGGVMFLRSTKIGKEAVDVAAAALNAVMDMTVTTEEVAAVRKEIEELKEALKQSKEIEALKQSKEIETLKEDLKQSQAGKK